MKGTLRWVYATLILAASFFALAACSTDDNNTPTGPKELPTFSDITVRTGDTGFIEFKAYATWTLSSSKPTWFKFASDTGKAGAQKIAYTVTDDGLGFEDDEAIITFSYKGIDQDPATFKATRTASERFLKLYKFDTDEITGNPVWSEAETIDLAYSLSATNYQFGYLVVSNFNWKLTVPEWIDINPDYTSGEANPTVNPIENGKNIKASWIKVNYAKATAEPMTGKVTFADRNAPTATIQATITCPGSTEYMVPSPNTVFALAMNADGKYVTTGYDPIKDDEIDVLHESYVFSLRAGNDDVSFFRVWKQGGVYGVDPEENGSIEYKADWCSLTSKNGASIVGPAVKDFNYELRCVPIGADTRTATIVAIPTAKAVGLTESMLVTTDKLNIKDEYQQYIVCEPTQDLAEGLRLIYPELVRGITMSQMNKGEELDGIKDEFGVKLVYTITYNSFDTANAATIRLLGHEMNTISVTYVPADALVSPGTKKGWLNMEVSEEFGIKITDEYVPFTSSRNALIIFKASGEPVFALKVVQNVPRPVVEG